MFTIIKLLRLWFYIRSANLGCCECIYKYGVRYIPILVKPRLQLPDIGPECSPVTALAARHRVSHSRLVSKLLQLDVNHHREHHESPRFSLHRTKQISCYHHQLQISQGRSVCTDPQPSTHPSLPVCLVCLSFMCLLKSLIRSLFFSEFSRPLKRLQVCHPADENEESIQSETPKRCMPISTKQNVAQNAPWPR